MAYEVRISKRAVGHLRHIYTSIRVVHSPVAEMWFLGLEAAIFSLEHDPQRNAPSSDRANLRQLLYGRKPRRYRVLYLIDDAKKVVDIVQIRHWARGALKTAG